MSLPADSRPGFWEALSSLRSFLIISETGGFLVMKLKDLSS